MKREAEDEAKRGASELTYIYVHYSRPFLSCRFLPLGSDGEVLGRMDLLYCGGNPYVLRCSAVKNPKDSKPFIVNSDRPGVFRRLRNKRFDSFADLESQRADDPVVELLLNCTNVSPYHFDLAERNYGVRIPVGWDFEKYEKKVGVPTKLQGDGYFDKIKQIEELRNRVFHKRQALRRKNHEPDRLP